MSCKCVDGISKKDKQAEEESFAMTLLTNYAKSFKRLFIALVVVLIMWFATIGGFIWYINQFDFSSESYNISTDGGGNANYLGSGGDINNGKN